MLFNHFTFYLKAESFRVDPILTTILNFNRITCVTFSSSSSLCASEVYLLVNVMQYLYIQAHWNHGKQIIIELPLKIYHTGLPSSMTI